MMMAPTELLDVVCAGRAARGWTCDELFGGERCLGSVSSRNVGELLGMLFPPSSLPCLFW